MVNPLRLPEPTAEWLHRLDQFLGPSRIAQAEACDPLVNPHAAAYFITRFCKTIDEERGGQVAPIKDWEFVLRYIHFLEGLRLDLKNGIVDKSRRMLGTWITTSWMMWRANHTRGFPAFATNGKGQGYTDDGGDHSTFRSTFGKMRFTWERLPDHVKRETAFAFLRAVCEENDAYISGEAPTEDTGRSGGYVFAYVDEVAHLPYGDNTHRALDPACRKGTRVYMGTHNGPATVFARLRKKIPEGWRLHILDWKDHPELAIGLTDTPAEEISRFGHKVSPAFRTITAALRDEDIAQEYNHSIERSTKGLVYKTWSEEYHMAFGQIEVDPMRELAVGIDYAATGVTAFAIGQPLGSDRIDVLLDYEVEGLPSPEHAKNLINALRSIGYDGLIEDVILVDGPDGNMTDGSGKRKCDYYFDAGFKKLRRPLIVGPGSLDRGIEVVDMCFRYLRIRVSTRCTAIPARVTEYRWPVQKGSGQILATAKPIHDDSEHVMSALRYLTTAFIGSPPSVPFFLNDAVRVAPRRFDRDLDMLDQIRRDPHVDRGDHQERSTVWDAHLRDL